MFCLDHPDQWKGWNASWNFVEFPECKRSREFRELRNRCLLNISQGHLLLRNLFFFFRFAVMSWHLMEYGKNYWCIFIGRIHPVTHSLRFRRKKKRRITYVGTWIKMGEIKVAWKKIIYYLVFYFMLSVVIKVFWLDYIESKRRSY